MNYKAAVAEGRRLTKRSEEDQWRLAELTFEVVQDGKSRRQWAKDIGAGATTAERYYLIWERHGASPRSTRPKFAEAYGTLSAPGQVGKTRTTPRAIVQAATPSQKVEMAQALGKDKDPTVKQALAASAAQADPKGAVQAVSKVAPKVVSDAANEIEWGPELPPLSGKIKATPQGDVMLTQSMLKTWIEAKRALNYVQNYEGNVPKISREAILEDLGRIRAVLDFIETRVKAGGPIDWDADFEALMEGN